MNQDDFIALVEACEFLNDARKELLKTNAAWMTDAERQELADSLNTAGDTISANNEEMMAEIGEMEEAINAFKKEEMPALMKEEEAEEHDADQAEAEKLIDSF